MLPASAFAQLTSVLTHERVLAAADFFALSLPPALMAALVFVTAYLFVAIPLYFRRDPPETRHVVGTMAGLFAGLVYIVFIVGIYPELRDGRVVEAPAAQSPQTTGAALKR
ncbi:hypothetical protein [Paraburkholderia kururiensis]|uniref:hypothetical protein n=1 Tax=Paraburkholderia kururiensis TaxID=984307 RepID=UPI0005A7F968|nr:hypothetical protein [Paraburkholderia kururiensis]